MGRTGGGAVSLITFLACPLIVALVTVEIAPPASAVVNPMRSGVPTMTLEASARLSSVTFITWIPKFGAGGGAEVEGSVMLAVAIFRKYPFAMSGPSALSVWILVSFRSTANAVAL